ncbi:hypothetical protein BJ165DRAFT_1521683 [Panaeolus papilionaceus]|nr:hypothetical protein BJ165DRAFT_1521683 [Panaeolus papilionaceus]
MSGSTQKAIKISYTISPPSDLALNTSLPVSKSHVFTIPSSSSPSSQPPSTTPASDSTTPASDSTTPSEPTTQTPTSTHAAQKAYYNSLLVSLSEAKQTVGEELTRWRDVIGKREGVVMKPDNEDEDEEGEGEE